VKGRLLSVDKHDFIGFLVAHVDKNIAKDAMITLQFYDCLKLMIIAYVKTMIRP
jgi:hypothetical protein